MNWYGQSIATGGGAEEPLDKILYDRYLKNTPKGIAIECGANDGLFLSTCKTFEEIGWYVINIEASKPNYDRLIINRPLSENYPMALSDKNNEYVCINHYDGDNGGVDKSNEYTTEVSSRFNLIESNSVVTMRYDNFIECPIDLFVLDVEGYELRVIEGMNDTKFWPEIFCIEHTHCGIANIQTKLCDKYRLNYFDSLNAVFVK